MNRFESPASLVQLSEILHSAEGTIMLLAGCTDLYADPRKKTASADMLINLMDIPEMKTIEVQEDYLRIGASCTHTVVAENALVRANAAALADACGELGSVLIRNRGTIGGSLCNASPAADIFPALLALSAQAVLLNEEEKERILPIDRFVLGQGKTALRPREVLTEIRIPVNRNRVSAFAKLGERKSVTIAKISVAVAGELAGGKLKRPRVVLGAVGEKAFLSESAAGILEEKAAGTIGLQQFVNAMSEEIRSSIPNRASVQYKSQAVRGPACDALEALQRRAAEKMALDESAII